MHVLCNYSEMRSILESLNIPIYNSIIHLFQHSVQCCFRKIIDAGVEGNDDVIFLLTLTAHTEVFYSFYTTTKRDGLSIS